MKQLFALAVIAFLVPATAALAENPCKADKAKFCKDVESGGGKVKECLQQHKDELSDACKERFGKAKEGDAKKSDAAEPAAAAPADGAAPGTAETKPQ